MKPIRIHDSLHHRGFPRLVAPLLVAAGALLALPTARLQAAPPAATPLRYNTYRIVVPTGFTAVGPRAINDAGVVVGELAPPQAFRAAFDGATGTWKSTPLGTLQPGNTGASYATGINNQGQVVGWSDAAGWGVSGQPQRAFVWDSGNGMRDLNALLSPADQYNPATGTGWSLYEAFRINDQGQVIGFGQHAGAAGDFFLLDGLESGTVTVQSFDPTNYFWPRDLNNALDLQVAGRVTLGGSAGYSAAVWQSGAESRITNTWDATAINNGGSVIGRPNGAFFYRGFLWSPGDAAPLILNSFRTTDESEALDLNDARQVVGLGRTSSLTARAALWENGSATPIDLRTISTTDKKWVFYSGRGISNTMHNGTARYIIGSGSYGSAEAAFVLQAR